RQPRGIPGGEFGRGGLLPHFAMRAATCSLVSPIARGYHHRNPRNQEGIQEFIKSFIPWIPRIPRIPWIPLIPMASAPRRARCVDGPAAGAFPVSDALRAGAVHRADADGGRAARLRCGAPARATAFDGPSKSGLPV